jgi:hypothetical protein
VSTGPALRTEPTTQAPHDTRAELAHALLNGSCSDQLARHDLFCHLYLCTIMMVVASVATTSFVILLLFSLPSCLHLRATSFLAEGVVACASSLYSSNTSSDTESRSGYWTSTRTFYIMRAPSFRPSSDVPFIFPAFALFFLPNLLPCLGSQPRADRRSSTRVRGESVMLLAFLRACRRGGHGGACHGAEESRSEILDNQGP